MTDPSMLPFPRRVRIMLWSAVLCFGAIAGSACGACSSASSGPRDRAPDDKPADWHIKFAPGSGAKAVEDVRAILDGDIAIHLRGTGWNCFRWLDDGRSVCRRRSEDCTKLRDKLAAERYGVSTCEPAPRAYCVRGKQRADGFELALCFLTEPECVHDREAFKKDPDLEFVSDCETLT